MRCRCQISSIQFSYSALISSDEINNFRKTINPFIYLVGLLEQKGSTHRKASTNTRQQERRKKFGHTYPCSEWHSNPRLYATETARTVKGISVYICN
jgi:hypothetical protein